MRCCAGFWFTRRDDARMWTKIQIMAVIFAPNSDVFMKLHLYGAIFAPFWVLDCTKLNLP